MRRHIALLAALLTAPLGTATAAAADLYLRTGDDVVKVHRLEPPLRAIRPGVPGEVRACVASSRGAPPPSLAPSSQVRQVTIVQDLGGEPVDVLELTGVEVQPESNALFCDGSVHFTRFTYRRASRLSPTLSGAPRERGGTSASGEQGHKDEIELLSWSWGETKDSGRVKVQLHWDRGRSGPGRVTFEGDQCLVFFLGAIPGGAAPGRTLPRFEGRTADGATFVLERARVTRLGPCRGGERKLEAWGWAYQILPQMEQ